MRRSTVFLLILLSPYLLFACELIAGSIDAQVLQFKLGRFYFNVGKEALVYPGNHFAIFRGKDTVVSGVIEESYAGVSIGRGSLPKEGRTNFEKYKAVLETAESERLSTVRLGALQAELIPFDSGTVPPVDSLGLEDRATYVMGPDTLRVEYEDDTLTILDMLERGEIDGAVVAGAAASRPGFHVQSAITPLFVMLLSNPISDSGGLLATSLYYRFDPRRLRASIADSSAPVNSFLPEDRSDERPYPFDPEKGKRLFRSINPRPTFVRIGIMTEHLRPVAMYFADLLAREQCRSSIRVDTLGKESDLYVCTGEMTNKMPELMLRMVSYLLYTFHRPGDTASVPAYLAGFQIAYDSADATSDTVISRRCLSRADDILTHDLGCFPLFRPRYSLIIADDVTGVSFDDQGRVRLSNPRRIKLPTPQTKEQR